MSQFQKSVTSEIGLCSFLSFHARRMKWQETCALVGSSCKTRLSFARTSDLSAFPRIAVIHGPKSALLSPHTNRMGIVHRQFLSRGCLELHENPKSDRLLGKGDRIPAQEGHP
jgi:hypothetical protein